MFEYNFHLFHSGDFWIMIISHNTKLGIWQLLLTYTALKLICYAISIIRYLGI